MKPAILLFTLFCCIEAVAQTADIKAFLAANKATLTPGHIDNPLFDNGFYRNRYFLFGENHGSSQPQLYDLALLKHLHERAGVNHYIAEIDFTKAWMLNNYLRDGNTAWLDKVFASWKSDTAQWANREYYNKFIALLQYQRTQPAAKRITVIGIDAPQDYTLPFEQLSYLTRERNFGKYQPLIDSLLAAATAANRKEIIQSGKRLLPLIESDPTLFTRVLGTNYPSFRHLVTSFSFVGSGMYRDSVMYRNLASQLELFHLQQEKMYGFLGYYHCLQTGYNNSMPFAALLKRGLHLEDSLVSIQMFALNSKTMIPFTVQVKQMMPKAYTDKLLQENGSFPGSGKYIPYELSNDNFMMKIDGIDALRDVAPADPVSLFRLSGTGSPFNESNKLAQVTGFQKLTLSNKADPTARAFQYILLFRNSEAATPLD